MRLGVDASGLLHLQAVPAGRVAYSLTSVLALGWQIVEIMSVSNSLSGGNRELHEVPAVRSPIDVVQIGGGHRAFTAKRERRVALQRRVAACRVVVGLEVGQFPFKITGIPEQHMVEKFSPHHADQALHEWV